MHTYVYLRYISRYIFANIVYARLIPLNRWYLAYLFIYVCWVRICISVLFRAFIDITVGWAVNYIEQTFECYFFSFRRLCSPNWAPNINMSPPPLKRLSNRSSPNFEQLTQAENRDYGSHIYHFLWHAKSINVLR